MKLLFLIKINKYKIETLSKKQINQDKAFQAENLTEVIKKILKIFNKE